MPATQPAVPQNLTSQRYKITLHRQDEVTQAPSSVHQGISSSPNLKARVAVNSNESAGIIRSQTYSTPDCRSDQRNQNSGTSKRSASTSAMIIPKPKASSLPRSPLLHKKTVSADDMEKELQRMYGSLPKNSPTTGVKLAKQHSAFCTCSSCVRGKHMDYI